MRMSDFAERLRWEAQSCPERERCPMAFLCGSRLKGGKYALPTFVDVGYGEMVWTDLTLRPRLLVVRSGLLLSKVYANHGEEVPYAVYGKGFLAGLTEIYGPFTASNFYFLSGLTPARLCSFDSNLVETQVSSLSGRRGQELAARALLNQTTANYGQMLTLAHRCARDRVASVLLRLDGLMKREEGYDGTIPVTHGDIASIAALDRSTVTRELKALAEAELVAPGYRSIEVRDALPRAFGELIEASLPFYDTPSSAFDSTLNSSLSD